MKSCQTFCENSRCWRGYDRGGGTLKGVVNSEMQDCLWPIACRSCSLPSIVLLIWRSIPVSFRATGPTEQLREFSSFGCSRRSLPRLRRRRLCCPAIWSCALIANASRLIPRLHFRRSLAAGLCSSPRRTFFRGRSAGSFP